MEREQTNMPGKTSYLRKFFAAFGIFFIVIGMFFAAFGLSFKVMRLPTECASERSIEADVERLKIENAKLEEEILRLEEQNDILMGRTSSKSSSSSDDED